jgi:pyruvate dehydrogenase E1 component
VPRAALRRWNLAPAANYTWGSGLASPRSSPNPIMPKTATRETQRRVDTEILQRICERAFAQMIAMIHAANQRADKRPGDPKVGGHPASCASALHVLGALHLAVREVHDYVCCKPHASPVDHAFNHLLHLFRRPDTTQWLSDEESEAAMRCLRRFPEPGAEFVFQSYHARTDPDSFHMLPSGSVGIPPVVSVYLALAHRYAGDHGYDVPPRSHYWSLIGDSEFREGSLLEAMPDVAERQLGNVTWIVDYNRQNLDGTRIPNERALRSRDCDRIASTAEANGWDVIQVQHGRFRQRIFERPGGEVLRDLFEGGLSDYDMQVLLFKRDAAAMREQCLASAPESRRILAELDDAELVSAFGDLGGHDLPLVIEALQQSKQDPAKPCLVIAHTVKGWNLRCYADPANHSTLPSQAEVEALLAGAGLTRERPFAHFPADTPEGRLVDARSRRVREGIEWHIGMRKQNRALARARVEAAGGLPETLDVDLSMFPMAHTQWMWGQLAAKLVRIGTHGLGHATASDGAKAAQPLSAHEARWKAAADYVLTLSPDVGTSTNIAPVMDEKVYGPEIEDEEFAARHPELLASTDSWTRHIRFEIAEANCMSAAGSFGKMGHYTGQPYFPIMTVYDFFIKRALDQLYYNLYWGSEFVIIGTPSGVTLSSEGAQHSWKSDIQIPNLITWEPLFAIEVDWILSDAIRRHMLDENDGRRGVLIRAVTRAIKQSLLLEHARRQARHKAALPAGTLLKPAGAAGPEWVGAVDESTLAPAPDAQILAALRRDCLAGGYYLVDWRGYHGYTPGDNVVNVFVTGSPGTEAIDAAQVLLTLGIFANVISVSSPELLLGILGEADDYAHLRRGLRIDGDLHLGGAEPASEAGLVSIAARRVPCVAVCDGEAGLLDNIGSVVGVKQATLAVRKFSKCGRPDQVYAYQHLDCASIVEAAGRVLSETALEDLVVPRELLERLSARGGAAPGAALGGAPLDWRALWPTAGQGGARG